MKLKWQLKINTPKPQGDVESPTPAGTTLPKPSNLRKVQIAREVESFISNIPGAIALPRGSSVENNSVAPGNTQSQVEKQKIISNF